MQTAVSSEGAHRVPAQVQAHAHKTIRCVGGLSADRQVISVADAAAVKPRVPKKPWSVPMRQDKTAVCRVTMW